MKFFLYSLIFFFSLIPVQAQDIPKAYEDGEWFKFRIHYGWFNASFATLKVKDEIYKNQPVHHIIGKGESTGLLDVFFKVDDNYETYIRKESGFPMKFIRKINEGGHEKDVVIQYDQINKKATVHDKKHNEVETFTLDRKVQDMVSVLYYLRNHIDPDNIEKGDQFIDELFFDDESFKFKTVFLGEEVLKTKFGKVRCLKFRPYVQAGRVFKEQESLTFWVSADKNKIPLKIKAKLTVGSLVADLDAYKGLKHPFRIIMD